jgi:Flp pilus assembly protein TadB
MWADGKGRVLLVASVLLQIAGVVMIWRMMNRTAGPEANA